MRERIERLQAMRDCALAISDQMRLSPGGDQYVYEGGTDLIDQFRAMECEMVSFDNRRSPALTPQDGGGA